MAINNELISPVNDYYFVKNLKYNIYIIINISTLDSLSKMFYGCYYLESIILHLNLIQRI